MSPKHSPVVCDGHVKYVEAEVESTYFEKQYSKQSASAMVLWFPVAELHVAWVCPSGECL